MIAADPVDHWKNAVQPWKVLTVLTVSAALTAPAVPAETPLRLLALSGSLRQDSSNTAILRTIAERVDDGVRIILFPLHDLPLYNGDIDTDEPPAAVTKLRDAIRSADAIIVSTPEYNYGIPGVLKNAIDWASRPSATAVLRDKAILVMSASPGVVGGARAHQQTLDALMGTMAQPLVRRHITIGEVYDKIRDGRLVHEPSVRIVLEGVGELVRTLTPSALARASSRDLDQEKPGSDVTFAGAGSS